MREREREREREKEGEGGRGGKRERERARARARETVTFGALTPRTGTQFEEEALMPGEDDEDPSLSLDALGDARNLLLTSIPACPIRVGGWVICARARVRARSLTLTDTCTARGHEGKTVDRRCTFT